MFQRVLNSKYFHSFGVYGTAHFLNSALNFLLLPVLTRYLTKEDYGSITMFFTTVVFIEPLIHLGIHGAVGRRFFDTQENNYASYVSSAVTLLFFNFLNVFLLMLIFSKFLTRYVHIPIVWILAAVIVAAGNSLNQTILSILQVKVKAKTFAFLSVVNTFSNIVLSLLFVIKLHLMWEGRALAALVTSIVFICASLIALKEKQFAFQKLSIPSIKHALRFGVPLLPHSYGSLCMTMFDRFILTYYLGLQFTGVYTVAFQIASVVALLEDAFNRAWVPWLYEKLKNPDVNTKKRVVRMTYLYFISILTLAVIWSHIGIKILPYLATQTFSDASQYILGLSIAFALGGMYKIGANFIFYSENTKYLSYITGFVGILNIASNFYFIPKIGIFGAVYVMMITNFAYFILTWIFSQKAYKMPWFQFELFDPKE